MKTIICSVLFGFMVGNTTPTTPEITITKKSKVEIYSALFWAPCKEAKKLLQSREIEYTEHMITLSRKNMKDLSARTGVATSVPQIFVDDKYFGGLSELKEYFK